MKNNLEHDRTMLDVWDINDPQILRKTAPPRVDDGEIPISSIQKFAGEDLTFNDKLQKSYLTNRVEFKQQMNEKKEKAQQQKQDWIEYAEFVKKTVNQLNNEEQEKQQNLLNTRIQTRNFNLKLESEREKK